MNIVINCNQCSSCICEVDENKHVGIQVQDNGGVYKIPILYGGVSPLYFCNNDCMEVYYQNNFSQEKRDEVKKVIVTMKGHIPAASSQLASDLNKIINAFKK